MHNSENALFATLRYRYLPYWPLFLCFIVIALAIAWSYINYYAIPTYEVTASLIIKDERKGVDGSKMTESIDAFTSNKIVENEINVIHSHRLMQQVVNKLMLYTPVYQQDRFRSIPAYSASPIQIKLKDPDNVVEHYKIYFTYNKEEKQVTIDNKQYNMNTWVQTPYGELMFMENNKQIEEASLPLYFSIINPYNITDQVLEQVYIGASNKLSTVIMFYIQDASIKRGEDILNTLIETYMQVSTYERKNLASNTLKFVENRIQLVEKELQALESQVVAYKSSNDAIDLSEQSKLYIKNVGDNDRKITELNSNLAVLDKVERYVKSKNKTAGIVPATLGINDPVLSQLLQKLYDSEIRYQKLRKTVAENNPVLVSITDEIESIRPSILENIANQRTNLLANRTNIVLTTNNYNAALQSIPQKERELLEISRQQAIKNDAYSFLLKKREETVLSYAPTAGDIRVVDMARSTLAPVSPNNLYIYLSAIIASFALGFVLIVGKEFMNDKLMFRHEIEQQTDAPIAAELSYVKKQKGIAFSEPKDMSVVEQFRQLRSTMGLYSRTFSKKKILVTSSIPGEGKSYVSSNLAYSLASSGKRVLLLDMDLRNPNTSLLFNLYKERGLTEYLADTQNYSQLIYPTAFENLYVIPAGTNVGDHTEMLLNGKLEPLFKNLETKFDYIIIDTPPLELVSDAYLLSEYCDISLLVLRHSYTPKNLVQRLAINNTINSLTNPAIVFNGIKARGFLRSKYGYGYGYGYNNKYKDKAYRAQKLA